MVAELVRASYLIGILTMLKVEGSNPGHPKKRLYIFFGMPAKNELIRDRVLMPRFLYDVI